MTNSSPSGPSPINTEAPEDEWVKSKSPDIVRSMFTEISPTYDTLNHVLSLNIDKRWRRTLARQTITPDVHHVLDICGGTGDLTLAMAAEANAKGLSPHIICADFTPAMTVIAKRKFEANDQASGPPVPLVADATRLPFRDDIFDLVTVAFGIRNVVDPINGLRELARVCKPGGQVVVLEFSRTRNPVIDGGFRFYFSQILPRIGQAVTGTRAYSYLSKSVERFPEGTEFQNMMSAATGAPATAQRLSFGIATLYISRKAATGTR